MFSHFLLLMVVVGLLALVDGTVADAKIANDAGELNKVGEFETRAYAMRLGASFVTVIAIGVAWWVRRGIWTYYEREVAP